MYRKITGYHQDEEGDWAAELDCLHTQHVRHHPPFQSRPWATTAAGRAARVGALLDCPLCERAELPSDLVVVRTAGPFDESTVPAGLQRDHQVPAGSWGLLHVLDGSVEFAMRTEPPLNRRLAASDVQAIPPQVTHQVRVVGNVRLQVDFLTRL
jgi:tellurite methyltransferase